MSVDVSNKAEAAAYALRDLAAKLGIDECEILLVESGETTWPDASLGMPEPGRMYAQMLTEGFLVVLKAAGKKFEYRFGNGIVKTRTVAFDD
jgi:hypothetical protein